jgi:hypothetical protein
MDNPFAHSKVVTGVSFCNRQQEIKDLTYYVQNNQTVLLYSPRRTGKTLLIFELMGKLKKMRPMVRSIYIDLYRSLRHP